MVKVFNYKDPKTLNKLFEYLSDKNIDFSVTLMPDIPEFIEAMTNIKNFFIEGFDADKLKERGMTEDIIFFLKKIIACEKNDIRPFRSLVFDCEIGGIYKPTIEYTGWIRGGLIDEDEILTLCFNPANFAKFNKWYSVQFKDVSEKYISKAKEAVFSFINNDYFITELTCDLNPYFESLDYSMERKVSEGSLYASKGRIEVTGKVAEDTRILNDRLLEEKLNDVHPR